jgi:putative restriction endonuclease
VATRTNQPGDEDLLDRFATINIWRRGEERAPHKPLLLLYALAALQRGEDRLIPFAGIEEGVGRLLKDFGPPRATRPEYPFWPSNSDNLECPLVGCTWGED